MSFIHGHCGCGALKYKIDISNIDKDLALSAYCHCASCQRINGAPFIWTSHWEYDAVVWDPPSQGVPPGAPSGNPKNVLMSTTEAFSPSMQIFEALPSKKWKLRCKHCGSPVGSWNAGTKRWTILPVTIRRKPSTLAGDRGVKNDGDFDISEEIQQKIKPTHHQFYGAWRAMTINDNLDKWIGYKDTSLQMSSGNEYQDTKD